MPVDSPPLVPVHADSDTKVEAMKNLIINIARAMVDQPELVQVLTKVGKHCVVIELTVASDDTGKIIGKKGIHADAIRRLITAIGGKDKLRYALEIME